MHTYNFWFQTVVKSLCIYVCMLCHCIRFVPTSLTLLMCHFERSSSLSLWHIIIQVQSLWNVMWLLLQCKPIEWRATVLLLQLLLRRSDREENSVICKEKLTLYLFEKVPERVYLSTPGYRTVSSVCSQRVPIRETKTNKRIWCASLTQQVPLSCSLMLSGIRRELCSQLRGSQPIVLEWVLPLAQSCASHAPASNPHPLLLKVPMVVDKLRGEGEDRDLYIKKKKRAQGRWVWQRRTAV